MQHAARYVGNGSAGRDAAIVIVGLDASDGNAVGGAAPCGGELTGRFFGGRVVHAIRLGRKALKAR